MPRPGVWQAVDPARAGKITGMLLELDVHFVVPLNVHKIVALLVSPDMVRSTSPQQPLVFAHPPGYAWCCSCWISSGRRKRC